VRKTLVLLRSVRTSRREVAIARVAVAKRHLQAADLALHECLQLLKTAFEAQQRVLMRQGDAADPVWRNAMLPSCAALVAMHHGRALEAQNAMQLCKKELQEKTKVLTACERGLIRTDELERLTRESEHLVERLSEQSQDDDLAASRRSMIYRTTSHS
jgi:hypothetical protein